MLVKRVNCQEALHPLMAQGEADSLRFWASLCEKTNIPLPLFWQKGDLLYSTSPNYSFYRLSSKSMGTTHKSKTDFQRE